MAIKPWIAAMRPRTLPLSLACIGMGTFLAAHNGHFNGMIFLFCVITTIFLQILSNLSNDYGDSVHGADSEARVGPARAVQSGEISMAAMRRAMGIFSLLSLASGVTLLWLAFGWELKVFLFFLGLGLLAILAAITYTSGYRPYGYAGLGDLSVLIFFGIVGVTGTYYLFAKTWEWVMLLPAASCGLFSVAVLNINNIRDISSDREAGKRSIPVRIGHHNAVRYHWLLLVAGVAATLAYGVITFEHYTQFTFILSLPLLVRNGLAVSKTENPQDLDPFLKQMALSTLFFVLSFGIGPLLL